jgi:hypothetical protein
VFRLLLAGSYKFSYKGVAEGFSWAGPRWQGGQGGKEGRTYIYRYPLLSYFQLFYVHQFAARNNSFVGWEDGHGEGIASGSEYEDIQHAFVG